MVVSAASGPLPSRAASLPTPTFTMEPPGRVIYSSKHGTVIPCALDTLTNDAIRVTWWTLTPAGIWTEAPNVANLRIIRSDGTLALPPLSDPATQYQPLIHSNVYRCLGHYQYGVIGSRPVKVKAGMLIMVDNNITCV